MHVLRWFRDLYQALRILPAVVLRLDKLLKQFDRQPNDPRYKDWKR